MRGELEKLGIIRDIELPTELFQDALAHDLESFRQRVAVETPFTAPHSATATAEDAFSDRVSWNPGGPTPGSGQGLSRRPLSGRFLLLRPPQFPKSHEWKATGPAFYNTRRAFIRNSYKSHYRQMVPKLLATLDFRSNNDVHRPVIQAIEIIRRYSETKLRYFPPEQNVPLDFLPSLWRETVIDGEVDGRPRVNRITYEIATLSALRDQVRCKEISVWQLVAKIPADAQYDDLGIEMAAFEELVEAQ